MRRRNSPLPSLLNLPLFSFPFLHWRCLKKPHLTRIRIRRGGRRSAGRTAAAGRVFADPLPVGSGRRADCGRSEKDGGRMVFLPPAAADGRWGIRNEIGGRGAKGREFMNDGRRRARLTFSALADEIIYIIIRKHSFAAGFFRAPLLFLWRPSLWCPATSFLASLHARYLLVPPPFFPFPPSPPKTVLLLRLLRGLPPSKRTPPPLE